MNQVCTCSNSSVPSPAAARRGTDERGGPLVRALRARFPGLRKLQLARLSDGRWLQLGFWDNREHAQAAADEMFELPEMSDWLAQVDEFADAA